MGRPESRPQQGLQSLPKDSPEAVLAAFIEADLGDFFNREADERYQLWWDLTEKGGMPDSDNLRLYIKSYAIRDRKVVSRTVVVVNIELDVRAIGAGRTAEGFRWRPVPVIVNGTQYRADATNS